MKGFRRRAREAAFQFLYRQDVAKTPDLELERHLEHFETPEESRLFASELAIGTQTNLAQIDKKIEPFLEKWKLERLPIVDRNLLRLGFFELSNLSTDHAVVINEIVELAKHYSGADSSSFVNGVLDRFARQIRPQLSASNLSA